MASPSQSSSTYHVFLSFRGPDSRNTIVSHLYHALTRAGIYTYIDNEELKKGERISEALPRAIEDSCIALVVLSDQYPTSRWCLKEVTKIMERRNTEKLVALHLFYKVEPKKVRKGRDSYKEVFDEYRMNCRDGKAVGFNLKDVKIWEDAFCEAAELSGWESKNENEAKLVEDIVGDISRRLGREPLHVDTDTVGMLSQVSNAKSYLNIRSEDGVQAKSLVIGLWAMGGMGKTTLAKLLYNSIFKDFQDAAFLQIPSDSNELKDLQETMLFKLTHTVIKVTSHYEGITFMNDRLKSKKILLILDGVNDECQIDYLIGRKHDFFHEDSRIIITTRDQSILDKYNAVIYEVKALENHEARELFRMCASEDGNEDISRNLVERALQCTGCVPLALKELGSAFRGKSGRDRLREMNTFARRSDPIIHKELKKSLDGLDNTTNRIFLDIACFFNGWNRKYVEGLLGIRYAEGCDKDGCSDDGCSDVVGKIINDHVKVLIERSLIRDENGIVRVHPLIELMGQKIEGAEQPERLGSRERLWRCNDVVRVLSDDERKYAVEAIVLAPKEPKELENIGSNPFKKLDNLRLLIMINVKFKTSSPVPIDLPRQLRWFEWPECPASSLKFFPTPWNPAVLAVRKSLLLESRVEP